VAKDVVVILGTTFTVIESDFVAETPSASVIVTENVALVADEPTAPEIAPVEALSVRPLGRLPDARLHVYGAVPPVPARVCE
jgi:hypothetical protein